MTMAGGARIPGSSLELDPVRAAFDLGLLMRWRDDTQFFARASWGHPAEALGALLALFDYRARRALHAGHDAPLLRDLLQAALVAGAIQSRLELPAPLDNPCLRLRIAVALVAAASLGGNAAQLHAALEECLLDGAASPRAQRRWCVADAGSRGLWHALGAVRRGGAAVGGAAAPVVAPSTAAAPFDATSLALRAAGAPEFVAPVDAAGLLGRLDAAVAAHFTPRQIARIRECLAEPQQLDTLRVSEFVARFVMN
jgi:2-methylcitrate dehydratase PrpD